MTPLQIFALAAQHYRAGRLEEAVAAYRHGLELQPLVPDAHNNLGVALAELGRTNEAIRAYQEALILRPVYPEACNNLGNALKQQWKLEEAAVEYRRALQFKPSYPEAYNNLGTVLASLGSADEAIVAYQRALALKPDFAEAFSNLGNTFKDRNRLDEAKACYQHALALNPGFPDAYLNRGVVSWLSGRFRQAEDFYRRAIGCRSDFADAHFNLGTLLLLLGRYDEGWPEYEWRNHLPAHVRRHRRFTAPQWDGSPASGKSILIHTEQGYGDTLLFIRYLSLVQAQSPATKLIVACPPALVPLLKELRGSEVEIISHDLPENALPQSDFQIPLLSLPATLQRFTPFCPQEPYLHADLDLCIRWRERFRHTSDFLVGLAWAGNPSQSDDRRRSMDSAHLGPILRTPGARFVSLQVANRFPMSPDLAGTVTDFTANLTDFAQSAALVAELDLIITVDTATAHLAGALGRPVWVLLPYVPHWIYGLQRDDMPWYPTMRLFRQPTAGNWEQVIERVAAALEEWIAEH